MPTSFAREISLRNANKADRFLNEADERNGGPDTVRVGFVTRKVDVYLSKANIHPR